MPASKLHEDDFIEMLERGDAGEKIAAYCGITVFAVERRFSRLPEETRQRIMARRKMPIRLGNKLASV